MSPTPKDSPSNGSGPIRTLNSSSRSMDPSRKIPSFGFTGSRVVLNVPRVPVRTARHDPFFLRKCWQRVELGIHGLNRWTVNCPEMSRKRGVQAARNGPSPPPTPAGGPVAKTEMTTADRLGSREESSRAGWHELLRPWGDERVRSLSHRGAVSFRTHFHRYWTGVR